MLAVPHQPYPLQSFDIIKLAKGMTVIHFSHLFVDQTLEFDPSSIFQHSKETPGYITIDWDKRECLVNGNRIVMSEKEYLLIKLLHDHSNRMVSIQEIKQTV